MNYMLEQYLAIYLLELAMYHAAYNGLFAAHIDEGD